MSNGEGELSFLHHVFESLEFQLLGHSAAIQCMSYILKVSAPTQKGVVLKLLQQLRLSQATPSLAGCFWVKQYMASLVDSMVVYTLSYFICHKMSPLFGGSVWWDACH